MLLGWSRQQECCCRKSDERGARCRKEGEKGSQKVGEIGENGRQKEGEKE